MTKSAQKEPSMDEILSSIRQIIAADDAAAAAPRRPSVQPSVAPQPRAVAASREPDYADMLEDREPLALSPAQMINRPQPTSGAPFASFDAMLDTAVDDDERDFVETGLVDPDDIAFAEDEDDDTPAMAPPPRRYYPTEPMASFAPEPELAAAPVEAPPPAPLPHEQMSADLTDQLIEPVTQAAVRGSMHKLNGLAIGTPGITIESMVRDMLRPMLKQWLDENLPAVVERLVEKEIARVSRGE